MRTVILGASNLDTGAGFRRNLDMVQRLRHFAEQRNTTVGQLAVAWALDNSAMQVAIVGSRNHAHLEESLGALDLTLTTANLAKIDGIMTNAVPLGGPSPEGMTGKPTVASAALQSSKCSAWGLRTP